MQTLFLSYKYGAVTKHHNRLKVSVCTHPQYRVCTDRKHFAPYERVLVTQEKPTT